MHMKTFLHVLKKFLNDKYSHREIDFYLSRRAENVHMDFNYSLLTLHEYEKIISDIEELWLMKRQDLKFKFALPSLYILLNENLTISYLKKILSMATIECKRYSGNVHILRTAYQRSAGYDLSAVKTKVLKPWGRTLINLDLNIAIPECYYGRVAGRSGLANTPGFIVHNGVIDLAYHCIVCVVVFNLSDEEYLVKTANRITQLTNERCFSQSL